MDYNYCNSIRVTVAGFPQSYGIAFSWCNAFCFPLTHSPAAEHQKGHRNKKYSREELHRLTNNLSSSEANSTQIPGRKCNLSPAFAVFPAHELIGWFEIGHRIF
jgi:hypothetical protein